MTQHNLSHEGFSNTHYVACSAQDNRLVPCSHLHRTIAEAAACIESVDGSIRAFTDGQERALTREELNKLVTELLALVHLHKQIARQDDLTEALNRRAFNDVLLKLVLGYQSKLSRRKGSPLSFAYMDLDGFKALNDNHGHLTGDSVLRVVVETIRARVRDSDSIARLGGDEFGLLLPDTGPEGARILMGKVQAALRDVMRTHQWDITFSAGVATFKSPPRTVDRVIDIAERQMRFAKSQGKDRISYLTVD